MYVSQVLLSQLPNIEVVSLLIIVTTCIFGVKALCSVYIFVICEFATYGFGIWSVNYLYTWAILCIIILFIRKIGNREIFALISGIFGLCFGTLCSIPYFLTGGLAAGFAYIVQGFWFDILHCGGNLIITYLLFNPVKKGLQKAVNRYI